MLAHTCPTCTVVFLALAHQPPIAATLGFDTAGIPQLDHGRLLRLWPELLNKTHAVQSIRDNDLAEYIHIPGNIETTQEAAKAASLAVPDIMSSVIDGARDSGHSLGRLRMGVTVKLTKSDCYGGFVNYGKVPHAQTLQGERVRKVMSAKEGFSVVVMDMVHISEAAQHACDALAELYHSSQCYANWYVTPAAGSCAYLPHVDMEDNFVIQLAGTKTWRMYNTTASYPTLDLCEYKNDCDGDNGDIGITASRAAGEPSNVSMRPGDALYVPRGMVHDAIVEVAGDSTGHSSHVTLAVRQGLTWNLLLLKLFRKRMADDESWRETMLHEVCATALATKCPKAFAGVDMNWFKACSVAMYFAASSRIDLRRRLQTTVGKTELEEYLRAGIHAALQNLHEALLPGNLPEANHKGVVEWLRYAARKGALENIKPKSKTMKKILKDKVWLAQLGKNILDRLDFAFDGSLAVSTGPTSALISQAQSVIHSAAEEAQERRKHDRQERLKELADADNILARQMQQAALDDSASLNEEL